MTPEIENLNADEPFNVDMEMEDMSTPAHFTKDNVNELAGFKEYRKKESTRAIYVPHPFSCVTVDGNHVECSDGFLAIDNQGYPYPIERTVFESSYEPVTAESLGRQDNLLNQDGTLGEGGQRVADALSTD